MSDPFLPQMAGHAIVDMRKIIKFATGPRPRDMSMETYKAGPKARQVCEQTIALLKDAEHIVLPSDAVIYRQNFGNEDVNSEVYEFTRLPFPLIAFEYESTKLNTPDDPYLATKTITLAMDNRYEGGPLDMSQFDDRTVIVTSMLYIQGNSGKRTWLPIKNFMAWHLGLDKATTTGQLYDVDGNPVNTEDLAVLRLTQEKIEGNYGLDLSITLQACHALQMGVRTETHRDTVSTTHWKLAKQGGGGLIYKVLKVPDHYSAHNKIMEGLGGHHASPRWHKRRGHERRLKSGRIIPVRACMVGDKARGEVIKYYQVDKHEGIVVADK